MLLALELFESCKLCEEDCIPAADMAGLSGSVSALALSYFVEEAAKETSERIAKIWIVPLSEEQARYLDAGSMQRHCTSA